MNTEFIGNWFEFPACSTKFMNLLNVFGGQFSFAASLCVLGISHYFQMGRFHTRMLATKMIKLHAVRNNAARFFEGQNMCRSIATLIGIPAATIARAVTGKLPNFTGGFIAPILFHKRDSTLALKTRSMTNYETHRSPLDHLRSAVSASSNSSFLKTSTQAEHRGYLPNCNNNTHNCTGGLANHYLAVQRLF